MLASDSKTSIKHFSIAGEDIGVSYGVIMTIPAGKTFRGQVTPAAANQGRLQYSTDGVSWMTIFASGTNGTPTQMPVPLSISGPATIRHYSTYYYYYLNGVIE